MGSPSNTGNGVGFGSATSGGAAGDANTGSAMDLSATSPWMMASDGNLQLLQQSIHASNVPIDIADENGYTLLHAASSYNHIHILQWLIPQLLQKQQEQSKPLINAVDNEGDSALHYAGNKAVAQTLIELGNIDVTIRNANGQTALEAKQEELNEMKNDEDYEEDDIDVIHLNEIIQYLSSLSSLPQ